MTPQLPRTAWLLLLASLAGVSLAAPQPAIAVFSACVLAVAIGLARLVQSRALVRVRAVPRSHLLTRSTTVLRQYAPAVAGRPQPRAPGAGRCAPPR